MRFEIYELSYTSEGWAQTSKKWDYKTGIWDYKSGKSDFEIGIWINSWVYKSGR